MLTLAVVDVDDRVSVAQRLGDAADETLRALGRSVDCDEVERTLGSRHCEIQRLEVENCDNRGVLFRASSHSPRPHKVWELPLRLFHRARNTPLSVSTPTTYCLGFLGFLSFSN